MNELISQAQNGDRRAMNQILHGLLPDIRRRVQRYVGGAEADDIAQQAMIEVAKSIKNFRGDSTLRTWATRITVRVAFRHIKRRSQVLPFDAVQEPSDDRMQARRLDARDRLRTLRRCLNNLSPERRMVFVLQDVEGHTAPEVAEMLDIPLGTVYGRLRDARRLVQAALAEHESEMPCLRVGESA